MITRQVGFGYHVRDYLLLLVSDGLCRLRLFRLVKRVGFGGRLFWHDRPGAFLELAGKRRPIPARRFVLIPPHTHLACGNTATFGQLFLHFRLEPGLAGHGDKLYFAKADAALDRLARTLRQALQTDTTTLDVALRAQALLSLALLTVPEADWAPRWEDARITAAAAAIRAAYPSKLANAVLAHQAGLHPGAFIRLFRQTTGHTPGEFLANLRLEEACTLLHSSELSIDEVAAKTGFSDRGYFSRRFAARIGISPALQCGWYSNSQGVLVHKLLAVHQLLDN